MKSHQFPSYQSAIDYCKVRGELTYYGREGIDAKEYVYTLTVGHTIFHILIHENGMLRVLDIR